ncbi:MAG: winged helix-turn-helix domain-containing protein [Caldilineaceae bacterium]|nr:winged helix-turn-helix domain-containing protein [Caldilineaceae bacterium]
MTRKVAIDGTAEDTAAALHAQYRAEKVTEVRTRLPALWLLRQGQGPTAVAAAVGVSRNSVQPWLRGYRAGGLAEVRAHRRGGHGTPSYLTEAQAKQVVAEAAQGVFATAQAVRDWIEEQFGVVYTRDSMYTLLPRLGIRRKVPRPRHAKTDPQAQETWKKGGSGSAWPRSA